jgi:hypothetical protein
MDQVPRLLKMLREATRQLPALKFAWGLLGLMAVGTIAIAVNGNFKAAIAAAAFGIIGFVVVMVAVSTSRSPDRRAQSKFIIWVVEFFIAAFLIFTVTAYGFDFPCNWVRFLEIDSAACRPRPVVLVDYKRVVDFTRVGCRPDGIKNDFVVYSDDISFEGKLLPEFYRRTVRVSKEADVKVRDLVSGQEHEPTLAAGGREKYSTINFVIDRSKRKARFDWLYTNAHSTESEGVGFTPLALPFVLRSVDVTYKLPAGLKLTNRHFEPAAVEAECARRGDGFSCKELTAASFSELFSWNAWTQCS